jgi:hypothetical protein
MDRPFGENDDAGGIGQSQRQTETGGAAADNQDIRVGERGSWLVSDSVNGYRCKYAAVAADGTVVKLSLATAYRTL